MQAPQFRAEPLQWSEGMLLSPQHFQQNDIYWHQQLAHGIHCTRPYAWGLWDLELDQGDLRQGRIRVTRLEARLPDGLAVQYPASAGDNNLAPLDVGKHPALGGLNGRLTVHLAVAKRMRGAASDHSDLRRYTQVPGGTALDENTGSGEIELERLRACLMLLPTDQVSGGHVHIPLLEIQRTGNEFALSHYHPPLLRAKASGFLGKDSLLAHLESLLRELVKRASGQAGDVEGQRLVYALTAALPALNIMVQSGETHPFELYLGLASLLGQVAQIAASPLSAMSTIPYHHNDAQPGFEAMLSAIGELVRRVRVGHQTLAFQRVEAGRFEVDLAEDWNLDDLYIELRGKDRRGLEKWLHDAHIGDVAWYPQLDRRRLPGAGRQVARDDLSRRLPVAEDGVLFSLVNTHQRYDDGHPLALIKAGGRLRVSGPPDGAGPNEMRLYYRPAAGNPAAGKGRTPPMVNTDEPT
jgi:type VI secretion system protein ImpJ